MCIFWFGILVHGAYARGFVAGEPVASPAMWPAEVTDVFDTTLEEINERTMRLRAASRDASATSSESSLFEWASKEPFDMIVGGFVRSVIAHTPALVAMANVDLLRNAHGVVGQSAGGILAMIVAAGKFDSDHHHSSEFTSLNGVRNMKGRGANPARDFLTLTNREAVSFLKDFVATNELPPRLEDFPKPVAVPTFCFNGIRNSTDLFRVLIHKDKFLTGELIFLNAGPTAESVIASTFAPEDVSRVSRPRFGISPVAVDGRYPCVDGGLGDMAGFESLRGLPSHPSRRGARRVLLLQTGNYPHFKVELPAHQFPVNVSEVALLHLDIPPVAQGYVDCHTESFRGPILSSLTHCSQAVAKVVDITYSQVARRIFKPMGRLGRNTYVIQSGVGERFGEQETLWDSVFDKYEARQIASRFVKYHPQYQYPRRLDWEE